MTPAPSAFIVGAYEHPLRKAPDHTIARLHAEVAAGALQDAGLGFGDVDGLFTSGDSPGLGPASMAEYFGIRPRHVATLDTGGSSYILAAAEASRAIADGRCDVALVTLAGKPRTKAFVGGEGAYLTDPQSPEVPYELPYGLGTVEAYALSAMRHMHEFGTTPEQLAWVKVAASHHARHNPNAMLRDVVTVDDVLGSPMIADPLHRLDCCVVSDGGGALVLARPEIARSLDRPLVTVRGAGVATKNLDGGRVDPVTSAGVRSGAAAFAEARLHPADVQYASVYDSFTITVVVQLEDLGFCEKGKGGAFVADGNLISGVGTLPVNTDGGGLCNNHPGNRGGMTKMIEAVRQLRGEAHPAVQVPDCTVALAHGTGGYLSTRHTSATVVLERV
ncbi:acetyl-CoA acetyltransferase (plasmid) [Pseudonocardia sp. EC080610-09]|uniref:thiolase domain-containing protein n=1 Tax=unclassified Pseudonocardia TaxID=2619320 RepID=UPI0007056946|nr:MULTISPECIES: thiolase domain-containing protein [unclassified Pseudonocardia]ALL79757.1 acetyl-CoA acetyltransferase [Pseudonocardia sp. EC080610-09]ALL85192.1 acetyl-CoA acetyltransferase [Pseudonocardia sp. EC080619-01]